MSILSFSFLGDTTERITAWERETATYERDSGKFLDDEIKVGAVLLRFARITVENNLLMRVGQTEKVNRLQRRSGFDFSCDCRCSVTADTDGHWSSGQGGDQARVVRDRKELANVTIRPSKRVPGAETRITLLQTVLTLTKRAENVERLVIWQVCVDLLELLNPRPRVVRRAREVARVRIASRLVGTLR